MTRYDSYYFVVYPVVRRGLSRKQHEFLRRFLSVHHNVVSRRGLLIFRNNGLGAVRALQLIEKLSERNILDIRALGGSILLSAFPTEYRKLAGAKKLGKRQRARLLRSPGVETIV